MIVLNVIGATPLAHAGAHQVSDWLVHALTEPDHLVVIVVLAAATVFARTVWRQVVGRRGSRQVR